MIETNTPPSGCKYLEFLHGTGRLAPCVRSTDKRLLYTLLPRMEGVSHSAEWKFRPAVHKFQFEKRFVTAGLRGRESVQIAYMPECMDTIWLYEGGTYTALSLVQKTYLGKTLAEVAEPNKEKK